MKIAFLFLASLACIACAAPLVFLGTIFGMADPRFYAAAAAGFVLLYSAYRCGSHAEHLSSFDF